MRIFLKLFLASLILSFSQVSLAGSHGKDSMSKMTLNNDLSSLSFVSIKKGTVGEVHSIDSLSGSLSEEGDLLITLDLTSVNTNIDIRNDRMKKYFFETEKKPIATILVKIGKVTEGVSRFKGSGLLNLHGVEKNIDFEVIYMMSNGKLVVSSAKPIIINASDYGLEGGIEMLKKLAKLPSIATAVPVSFVLTFDK